MTRYVQNRDTGELEEVSADFTTYQEPLSPMVMPDIDSFVSPVDKSIVHSRSQLREHNKIHGVTNSSDYVNEWQAAAKKREALRSGTNQDRGLRQSLEREFERRSK